MAECEGLALVTFAGNEIGKIVKRASKGCDMWYQSKVPIFELAL